MASEKQAARWWHHITLGNLINLATLLLVAAGFYYTTTFTLSQHTKDIAFIFTMQEADRKATKDFRDQLIQETARRIERDNLSDMRMIERLTAVEVEVRGLRSDINRLSRSN